MKGSDDDVVYAGLAACMLPHKDVGAGPWRTEAEGSTVVFRGGFFNGSARVGVPFGSRARLILIYLQTQALRTRSRQIRIGSTLYEWTRSVHPEGVGGMTYRVIAEQSRRVAACSFAIGGEPGTFIDALVLRSWSDAKGVPRYLQDSGYDAFPEYAILSARCFDLCDSIAVPIRLSALGRISNSSVAIDLYIWLSSVLPSLTAPEIASWAQLKCRFGPGYKDVRHMRQPLLSALRLVLAVFPEARVDEAQSGLVLHPCRRLDPHEVSCDGS